MAKATDITVEDARGLVSDRLLWPRVRDFLWDFAPQVHASWVEDLLSRSGAMVQSVMGSPRVKRYVLESLGVEPCFHTFPKEDGSRLLLLDGATLESIAKWLGALACATKLRGVTSGADVRALKAALPGIYPDVFAYMAYFSGMNLAAKDAKGAEEVVAVGFGMLYSAFASLPSSLVSRLRFKFPKALCDLCVLCGEKEDVPARLQVVNKLLKLKFPEAYSLCCS